MKTILRSTCWRVHKLYVNSYTSVIYPLQTDIHTYIHPSWCAWGHDTWRRDDDARPENASSGTEDVLMMKDDSTTVKGEDLHASNKAIHFTCWRPVNERDREQHGIAVGRLHTLCHSFCPDVHHQLPTCSVWGTSCVCVSLVVLQTCPKINAKLRNTQIYNS